MAVATLAAPAPAQEPTHAAPASAGAWRMPARGATAPPVAPTAPVAPAAGNWDGSAWSTTGRNVARVDPTFATGTGAGTGAAPALGVRAAASADVPAPDAPEDESPSPPFFDVALGTYAPLAIGADATVELPGRVLLQGGFGWMPPAYGSLMTKLVTAATGGDAAL
ncbi:MAG: hypothetical protein IT373_34575, partial [Polyangiaceae bacterium]|nr:hypothetical protein [Polyangiaceae bacterium]